MQEGGQSSSVNPEEKTGYFTDSEWTEKIQWMDDIERRAPTEVQENNLPFFFWENRWPWARWILNKVNKQGVKLGHRIFFLHLQSESMEDQLHACTSTGDPDRMLMN